MRTHAPTPEPDAAWRAVIARDRREDGAFVYAVRTTGVYCRPSCPSRRPLRQNVAFFAAADDAERAGFRACHRCRPRSTEGALIDACVQAARAYLDAHLDEKVTLAALAAHVGVSAAHLQRTFKARVGLSPKGYADARRMARFKEVVQGGASVTEAMYGAGFGSSRELYERAPEALGMTPGAYRRGGRGASIRYTIVESALARVLVGATDRGVCAVLLAAGDEALTRELRREFPEAEISREDAALAELSRAVIARIEGGAAEVPLDTGGTAFQRLVWSALQRIPPGETRSYRQLAEELGRPRAARAVARACATNRLAVVVPCHRVVRGDGTISGYRWGVARKKTLLARERAAQG
jgi:AraC family transcriptional regulator, regulatory protein of adaptative response / methylated-DNA-[protein]-cysteine methyltransferase